MARRVGAVSRSHGSTSDEIQPVSWSTTTSARWSFTRVVSVAARLERRGGGARVLERPIRGPLALRPQAIQAITEGGHLGVEDQSPSNSRGAPSLGPGALDVHWPSIRVSQLRLGGVERTVGPELEFDR